MSVALLPVFGFAWFAGLSVASAEPPATVPPGELQRCARLSADRERLACYDQLAGRAAQSAPAPLAHAAGAAGPAPAAAARAEPALAGSTPAAAAAGASAGAATGTAEAAAPPPGTSFGSYAAEHPKPPPVANSLEAPIAALGKSASGHTTISLEGGAVWELDEPDPLLRVGDVVTIERAALGSYILHTPSKRAHRAHRLQ
jgi:hypothetical protein